MPGDWIASRRAWKVQFGRTRLSLEALGACLLPLPAFRGLFRWLNPHSVSEPLH